VVKKRDKTTQTTSEKPRGIPTIFHSFSSASADGGGVLGGGGGGPLLSYYVFILNIIYHKKIHRYQEMAKEIH